MAELLSGEINAGSNDNVDTVLPSDDSVTDVVLPSDEVEVKSQDDWLKENTSDNGKLYGQFDDMQSALEFYRKQDVTHTNNMRDIKNEQKNKNVELEGIQADKEAKSVRDGIVSKISMELNENNMVVTGDMVKELSDNNISVAEAQVVAYETKALMESNYSVAGSKENYDSTMEFATTIYSQEQQDNMMASISNNSVSKEFRELAILGLQSKMNSGASEAPRISGQSANIPASSGYSSFKELSIDKQAAKKDPSLKAKYLQKLAITDDKVLSLF